MAPLTVWYAAIGVGGSSALGHGGGVGSAQRQNQAALLVQDSEREVGRGDVGQDRDQKVAQTGPVAGLQRLDHALRIGSGPQ
jgi:hypothetical protein